MKKLFLFFFLTVFLFSCTNTVDPGLDQDINTTLGETASFERLKFSDEFSLEKAIEQGEYLPDAVLTKSTSSNRFVSLLNKKPKSSTKSSNNAENEDELTYYEALGFDTLVPNPNFAALLNPEGELEIDSRIMKITNKGTYIFPKDKEERFRNLYDKTVFLSGNKINDREYEVESGIFFYDTYGYIEPLDIIELEDEYEEPDSSVEITEEETASSLSKETKSGNAFIPGNSHPFMTSFGYEEVGFDNFPIVSSQRKTFFGKLIQGVTQNAAARTVNFPGGKRRVKGKFFNYNWGIISEAGVEGWTDAKRGLGNWTKTPADELRIGWRNIILVQTLPKELVPMNNIAEFQNALSTGSAREHHLYTTVLDGEGFLESKLMSILNKGGKQLRDGLKNLTNDLNKKKKIDDSEAVRIHKGNKIYTVILNDCIKDWNVKKLTFSFIKKGQFVLTFNPDMIGSIMNGIANIKGGVNGLSKPEIIDKGKGIINIGTGAFSIANVASKAFGIGVSHDVQVEKGEVYIAARFGQEWRGMRVTRTNAEMNNLRNEK
ncbi:MAG: hypothetical protein LBT43_00840 [Prevotella sp.]|jgi:hypothetical protein|nr:hypothetical protein [Prevotella sp.]